jgi:hypothetical protein
MEQMEVTYEALSSNPLGCVEFFGISLLPPDQNIPTETLCLVFSRATEGTIIDFIKNKGKTLSWVDVVGLFIDSANALSEGLHARKIVHR